MTTAAVSCKELSFAYPDNPILLNVNFDIHDGECIGVIGPNGGGKSTLLKLIACLLKPDKGAIDIFGKPNEDSLSQIAYVPQSLSFDRQFPISVLEVVLSGLISHLTWLGNYPKSAKEKAVSALEKVGLKDFAHKNFSNLSGGELQRVLIARALVSEPKLLLLDEPTASVDKQAEEHILSLLEGLKKSVTIIMVTHDLNRAVNFFDRLLVVQKDVTPMSVKEVCEHFAMGLYHTPMLDAGHELIHIRKQPND
ncbi:MAG: ABC transporter ATP-binding protein [Chlamydiia bacterium]|nr:ABC transporter ATP-binding protein [Chlamydiia bacterium]